MIRRYSFSYLFILLSAFFINSCDSDLSVIPRPQQIQSHIGTFRLPNRLSFVSYPQSVQNSELFSFLSEELEMRGVTVFSGGTEAAGKKIELRLEKSIEEEKPGRYYLTIRRKKIVISANEKAGLVYGIQTLLQIIDSRNGNLPRVTIRDYPHYRWRGLMLDCSRHFMEPEYIKRCIDIMAYYKMNRFHWHLTDDQGWRIDIKQYPDLVKIGSLRQISENKVHGGYYTQEEIREIISYAAARNVTVVPEIEMPGHCMAALAAYPQLSCSGGPFKVPNRWGVHKEIFCAGKEETFEFLFNVLDEVMDLFPSNVIHIGGDEVPAERWKTCTDCQERIKAENLANEEALQSYFIHRIETYLNDHGRILAGWEEIRKGGLAPNAILQSWRSMDQGFAAAREGHNVIMSPHEYTYFNQSAYKTPLHKVYQFNPAATNAGSTATHVLGAECCMWTEYAPQDTVDRYLFPRLLAFAEAMWSDPAKNDLIDFYQRLTQHHSYFSMKKIKAGATARPIKMTAKRDPKENCFNIQAQPDASGLRLHYTLDGRLPGPGDPVCDKILSFSESAHLSIQAYINDLSYGDPAQREFCLHTAIDRPIEILYPYRSKFSAGGDAALVDGIRGSNYFVDGFWQGYEGVDMNITIDLGNQKKLSSVSVGFLQKINSWIFMPVAMDVYSSADGINFTHLGTQRPRAQQKDEGAIIETLICHFDTTEAHYLRIIARNTGICPPWHHGAGGDAWIFADEIIVK